MGRLWGAYLPGGDIWKFHPSVLAEHHQMWIGSCARVTTGPKNDQDFEKLCLRLLRAHWKCPELQQYATRGQAQHGVDIIDLSGQEPLRAAQCKLHEEGKVTTPDEVIDEVEKAKGFRPPLGRYAIVTTGKVRKEVHDLLIAINQEHREKNLLS